MSLHFRGLGKAERSGRPGSWLELCVGLALLSAIAFYVAVPFGSEQQAQALGFEMRRNMRTVTDQIERDIRRAGFMVPPSGAVCAVDNVASPDWLYLSDASALDPESGATGSANGAPLAGDNVRAGRNPAWHTTLVIDESPRHDTDGDGVADADFRIGGGVIVTDRSAPERGSACGTVVEADAAGGELVAEIRSGVLGAPQQSAASDLVAIPAHEYRIAPTELLMRNGEELVRGAADLQVAFFVDSNHDNVEQIDELIGYGAGPRYVSSRVDLRDAREIRVHTVLLTRSGTRDGKVEVRRRTHTTRELLRNLVLRTVGTAETPEGRQ